MDWERIARIRKQSRDWLARLPAKAQIVLGLFLFAAVLMAVHTALAGKDASLHLTVQHGFLCSDVSLWIDGDLACSGKLKGSTKKMSALLAVAVQGSLFELL